jgi:hypothetical protein
VHDPGGNCLKPEDSTSRDEVDITSNSTSSDNAPCPADSLDHDRDKIIPTTLNVKSVCEFTYIDCPISEATRSRSSTKLPTFLYLDAERIKAAGRTLSFQCLADSLDFDCVQDIAHIPLAARINGNSKTAAAITATPSTPIPTHSTTA